MNTLPITLPDNLDTYLQAQITSGHYSTPSDYIQALIQADRDCQAHLETLALEGVRSGSSTPMTPEDWAHIRATVRNKLSQGK
ncbi:type II toxin-antitoxin system ParD family antitoxin [Chamaesiphon sp. GL140_3_metabinner_50]|uniref:ribbon-helix-helix domain-containing protein n=1 Tax=Chamaesiphon sp. GL140_3_metabinner_50 TaxID=2970812 RepID=UPI0025D457B6|nr:type II toxin-antitoxin system ParD family antitoxin [Chamaesiphon sp. GL140_3_metabinner_50]